MARSAAEFHRVGAWLVVSGRQILESTINRFEPFLECGIGIAGVQGGPREDRDSATGKLLSSDSGVTGGGIPGELGVGVLLRREYHDLAVCL